MVDFKSNTPKRLELTEKIIKDIKDTFIVLDGDKDGYISLKELGATMHVLDSTTRAVDTEDLINEMETDNLDFNTFQALWHLKLGEANVDKDYNILFNYFDSDRNGLVDSNDLINGFQNLGAKMSPEEANEMILEADLDGDKFLDIEEFTRMIIGL